VRQMSPQRPISIESVQRLAILGTFAPTPLALTSNIFRTFHYIINYTLFYIIID
jgi:hypothetical protein